jgi:hypothetical protein
MYKIVIATEKSQNSKTGQVSATYAPIQSCPSTCSFLNQGCYAQCGNTAIHLNRMNQQARELKKERPIDIARLEAKSIKNLTGTRPLRLHIVGDCRTSRAASILAKASKEYKEKYQQPVWTYTHSWKNIPREKWGGIAVLASCETIKECKEALRRGYAPSIVRLKPFTRSFKYRGLEMIPCPSFDKGLKCNECQRCWDDKELLKKNRAICFFPHGAQEHKAINVIRTKWAEQDRGRW